MVKDSVSIQFNPLCLYKSALPTIAVHPVYIKMPLFISRSKSNIYFRFLRYWFMLDIIYSSKAFKWLNYFHEQQELFYTNKRTILQQPSHIQQIHLQLWRHHPVLQSIRFDRIHGQRIQLRLIRSSRSLIDQSKTL